MSENAAAEDPGDPCLLSHKLLVLSVVKCELVSCLVSAGKCSGLIGVLALSTGPGQRWEYWFGDTSDLHEQVLIAQLFCSLVRNSSWLHSQK